jgi:AcrR family transcriptional regulator
VVAAGPALFLRYGHAEEAQLAQPPDDVPVDALAPVPLGRPRRDLAVDEVGGKPPDGRLLGRQGQVHRHFATKDEILEAVADEIVAQVDVSFFGTHDWRDALRLWGRSYRDALAAHPNVVPVLARGPGRRPAALAMADAVYGGLVDAGWPPARATHIGALMRYLVAGSALGSFARGFVSEPELYAPRYPHLGQAHRLAGHQQSVDEGAFELGLEALVDGLSRIYDAVVPARTGGG